MDKADLKMLLKLSARRPVSCVVALTKDKQGVVLLHKRTRPRKLAATMKQDARAAGLELDPSSVRFGRATVDGGSDGARVLFSVNRDAPAGMERALKPQLRAVNFPRCAFVTDAALESEPEDGEDPEDEMDGAGQSGGMAAARAPAAGSQAGSDGSRETPGQGKAVGLMPALADAAPGPAASDAGKGTTEGEVGPGRLPPSAVVPPEVARGVRDALAADPSRRPTFVRLLAQARAGVESGDRGAAEMGVAALRQELALPAATGGPALAAMTHDMPTQNGLPAPAGDRAPDPALVREDVNATIQGMDGARGAGPVPGSYRVAQVALPLPGPAPLPLLAMPMPDGAHRPSASGGTRTFEDDVGRAGRRMRYVGQEAGHGHIGHALGLAFLGPGLGWSYPPEVDDPPLLPGPASTPPRQPATLNNDAPPVAKHPDMAPEPTAPGTPARVSMGPLTLPPGSASLGPVPFAIDGTDSPRVGLGPQIRDGLSPDLQNALTSDGGFTPAPPIPPLPGLVPPQPSPAVRRGVVSTPIPDRPPAPPHTGNTNAPQVNLGNWQESFPALEPQEPDIFDMATPPNVRAAAKGYPGIGATAQGGPTFSGTGYLYPVQPGQKNVVTIKLTGSRRGDFKAANDAAGLTSIIPPGLYAPKGYTWHHVDDYDPQAGTGTMELVKTSAHKATITHSGSVAQHEAATGTSYK